MTRSVDAFIALGSNLGDRGGHLRGGRAALGQTPGVMLVAASRVYETEPVGPRGQGPYLNAVLAVATALSPQDLLARLLAIEIDRGRRRSQEAARWSARTLDLDLLLYGDLCLTEEGLEIPHPRLHERAFVLEPLCELAGDRLHPRLETPFERLRDELPDAGQVRLWTGAGAAWAPESSVPDRAGLDR